MPGAAAELEAVMLLAFRGVHRAPNENETVDLFLSMETLYQTEAEGA